MSTLLFDKCRLGSLELKNRFLMSAVASWKTLESGDVDAEGDLIHYEIAGGGPALILGGGIGVHPSARRSATAAVLDDDRRIPSFRVFAQKIRAAGSLPAFQITHSGIWACAYQQKIGGQPFAPSCFIDGPAGDYGNPQRKPCAATPAQIREVAAAYGSAAARARMAGYAAVQVHAAHESLLSQFLSPVSNLRRDEWGGPLENRCRMHREVLQAIRKAVGRDFPVYIKLGVQDGMANGLTLADGVAVARILARSGLIDAIEVSQGLSASADLKDGVLKTGITSRDKEAYFRDWTRQVKAVVKDTAVAVIMQGGLRSLELMEEIVTNGEADFVSLCRPYFREPHLIQRWAQGDSARAECLSCNACVLRHYSQGVRLECVLPH